MSNPAFEFYHVHVISKYPKTSANWYVEMFASTIATKTIARGENPAAARPIQSFTDFSSHNAWGDPILSVSSTAAISMHFGAVRQRRQFVNAGEKIHRRPE
jgi:hypothetical protein